MTILLTAGSLLAAPQQPMPRLKAVADGYRVAGRAHHADFDADGATFTLVDPTRPPVAQHPSLSLRLVDWGGHRVASGAEPLDRGEYVDYEHGDLIERYRLDLDGFEQQFVVAERPEAGGDLVFGIAVSGNVMCDATEAAYQSLSFVRADGQVISYGAAKTIDSTGHETKISTRYDGAGRIELIVPESVARDATYPLLVDPAVGFVKTLVPTVGSGTVTSTDIAYDPDNERYLVVWTLSQGGLESTWGRLYDSQGNPVVSSSLIASGADPSVGFTRALGPAGFCVAFVQNDNIFATVVSSATGAPLMASPVQVTSVGRPNTRDSGPSVSCGSGSVLVGYIQREGTGSSAVRAVRVRLLLPSGGALVRSTDAAIEFAGSGESVYDVQLPDYHVTEQLLGLSWRTRAIWTRATITTNPGSILNPFVEPDVRTCSFRIRANGLFGALFSVIESPSSPLGGSGNRDQDHPSIATTAGSEVNGSSHRFVLAWHTEVSASFGFTDVVRMAHYDMSGPLGTFQDVAAGDDPVVAAGGCEYTIAYRDSSSRTDIKAARIRGDGTVATVDRPVHTSPLGVGEPCAASRPLALTGAGVGGNTTMIAWSAAGDSVQGRRFEPVTATFGFLGTACNSGGYTPIALTNLTPAVAGNSGFAIDLSGAPPSSIAALLIGVQAGSLPLPGSPCVLEVALPLVTTLSATTDGSGAASVPLPLPCVIPNGLSLSMQFGVLAPGANSLGAITSNGVQLTWSH